MRRFTLWIIIPLLAALAACGGEAVPAASPQATQPPAAPPTATGAAPRPLPTDESGQPLAARVNGQPITQADFERALARSAQSSTAADPRALAGAVLDIMIEQTLIAQAAPALGVSVTEAEIDADVAEMTRLAGSPAAWAQWQASNLYTEQEYREATRIQLLTFRVRDAIAAQSAEAVPQVRARHILVASEADAQDVLRRLQAGEGFEALAATLSRDVTTRDRGGDLGFFIRENLTTPELADLAFSLQPGEVGGPVRTMLGYHVVQTVEFATAPPSDIDSALQAEARFADWLYEQRSAATIEIFQD